MRRDVRTLKRGEDHHEANLRDEVHGVGVNKANDASEGARRCGRTCLIIDREEDISGIIAHSHVKEVGGEVGAICEWAEGEVFEHLGGCLIDKELRVLFGLRGR